MYYVIHNIYYNAADRDFCDLTRKDKVVIAAAPAVSNGQGPGATFGEPVAEGYAGVWGANEFWGHGAYPTIDAARAYIHRTWPDRNDVLPSNVELDAEWRHSYEEQGVHADYQ